MINFNWGSNHKTLIRMDWRAGDQIWKIGELVSHKNLPTTLGVVEGVERRERLEGGKVGYHYVVTTA